jgi:predicted nucleotidyltransferase
MKNLYNIKFSDLNENEDFKKMFLALENSLKYFNIDFYLVGAIAKNVWMSTIHKQGLSRATKDFDIAVLIPTKKIFNLLKEHLINVNKFTASSNSAFCIIWKEKYFIDLLPFGEIENEDAKVIVDGKGFVDISVPGFFDIYKNKLTSINVGNVTSFSICSLVDIIILKLLAWNDRPEHREKDITDIGEIIYSCFEMYDDDIYDNYAYLFDDFKSDELKALSAFVIGVEIKKVLKNNNKLLQKLGDIIDENLNSKATLAIIMAKYFDTDIDFNINILKKIIQGLK